MDLNSTLSLLGLQPPNPSPHPGTSSGFCEICQKHVSNRTNHKFVHSHVSLFCCHCVEPAGVLMFVWNFLLFSSAWHGTYWRLRLEWHLITAITILSLASLPYDPSMFPREPPLKPQDPLRPHKRNHHFCRRRQPGLTRRVALAWQCAPLMTLVLFSASDQLVGRQGQDQWPDHGFGLAVAIRARWDLPRDPRIHNRDPHTWFQHPPKMME